MSVSYIAGCEFVREIRPLLEQQDADTLVRHLRAHWPNSRLRALLACDYKDATKTSLACLACCGTPEDAAAISPLLGDEDDTCSAVAEHAMWAIWFRSGDTTIDPCLARAVHLISDSRLREAIAVLDHLICRRPALAEAYNQRAIAYFLLDDHVRSIQDCRQTLRHNPYHFGAMAGLGHSYASLGQLDLACAAYREALRLHPRIDGIRQCLRQILATRTAEPWRRGLHVARQHPSAPPFPSGDTPPLS